MGCRGAALLVGLLLTCSSQVLSRCTIRLDVDPMLSTVDFEGMSTLLARGSDQPLSAPVLAVPGIQKGFLGSLYLSHSRLSCPQNISAWLAALPRFTISSSASSNFEQNLVIYPPLMPATTAAYVYNASNFKVSLRSTGINVSSNGSVSITWNATIARGFLYSNTIITGVRYDDLSNLTTSFDTLGMLSMKVRKGCKQ